MSRVLVMSAYIEIITCAIFLLLFNGGSSAQAFSYPAETKECRAPSGQLGSCINIRNCPPIIAQLQNLIKTPKPWPAGVSESLKAAQCGYEGKAVKVCCENRYLMSVEPSTTQASETSSPMPPDVTRHPNIRLLDHALCGPITQQKIFGGNKTGILDFPWMALIAYQTTNGPEFRCGGSLISKRYVLTAAHCVTGLSPELVLKGVRLGEHDISKEIDCDRDEEGLEVVCAERYQDFGIERLIYHPDYRRSTLHNDIALIRLNADADLQPPSVRPICLPIGSAATIGQKKVTITGWGATELGPRSQDLLRAFVTPVSNDECATTYRKNTQIWYKQMCAGGHNQIDSCQGDSGGPLQAPALYNNTPRYVQYGIVSFGTLHCGNEGYPGVYTRLSYYLDWVLDNMTD